MVIQTKGFLLKGQDRVKCNRHEKRINPVADEWKSTCYSSPCRNSNPSQRKRERRDYVTSTGVVFIPSDSDDLVNRHRILFGGYQPGNTGVFNELQAINDKILIIEVFDIDMIRRLNVIINGEYNYRPN